MSHFYYFGYGSNLLSKRIRVQNKSAERVGMGKLDNYRLDFADTRVNPQYYSSRWAGSPATIILHENSTVYGAVWRINDADLQELDRQEGVECNIYKPIELNVFVEKLQKEIKCRSYQLVFNPETPIDPVNREETRKPSKTYLNVIINGAIESELPFSYVEFLKTFQHNDKLAADADLIKSLQLTDLV